ncbi:peptide deformylase [Actinopolymorpha alba]|uniref:peptide deformylase n=1 Tax=Actinopolymorpha alba TaxID=533267 RepID=UPI00036DE99E|nr:peptide deformylase [Actinopolymorpha alba]
MGTLPSGGNVRPITRWGQPVMHHPCRPVDAFDEHLSDLVADMVATMEAADGVGLAANQIGVDLRVFVFRCTDADEIVHEGVVCNPVLELPTGQDRRLEESDEGCLSLPGAFVLCARPDTAVVRGVDQFGAPVEVHGTGLLARCLQHETDHLEGTVFADRLPKRVRRRLFAEAEDVADEFGPEWPAGS